MHGSEKWKWSCSVVSDSSRPLGPQPTRLLCPWDFPGKSTGVECHCLLLFRFLRFYLMSFLLPGFYPEYHVIHFSSLIISSFKFHHHFSLRYSWLRKFPRCSLFLMTLTTLSSADQVLYKCPAIEIFAWHFSYCKSKVRAFGGKNTEVKSHFITRY